MKPGKYTLQFVFDFTLSRKNVDTYENFLADLYIHLINSEENMDDSTDQ